MDDQTVRRWIGESKMISSKSFSKPVRMWCPCASVMLEYLIWSLFKRFVLLLSLSGRNTGLFWPIRAWGSTATPSLRRYLFSSAIKLIFWSCDCLTTSLMFLRPLIWTERSICQRATMWPNSQFRGTMASKSLWVMLFYCLSCISPHKDCAVRLV